MGKRMLQRIAEDNMESRRIGDQVQEPAKPTKAK